MNIIELLTQISSQSQTDHVVFTGICDKNRLSAVYNALEPTEVSAVGTLVMVFDRHPDIPYRYEIGEPTKAASEYHNDSIDLLYIGNHNACDNAQELVDAWLPKLKTGGYMVCFGHFSNSDDQLEQVYSNTQEYPDCWWRIK